MLEVLQDELWKILEHRKKHLQPESAWNSLYWAVELSEQSEDMLQGETPKTAAEDQRASEEKK